MAHPDRVTWRYDISMPPDGGAGGITVFAALDAAYWQFGFIGGPNPKIISGAGDADPQGPMASMVNPYQITVEAGWNADPNGRGRTPPSALGPASVIPTPGLISSAHPMWRPNCIVIGAEDWPESKADFTYTNLRLFILFNHGPGAPVITPGFDRPADRTL